MENKDFMKRFEDEFINNIKNELCNRIIGDISVESHGFQGGFVRVLDIFVLNNVNRDIFCMSFNLDYFNVGYSGNISTLKQYQQYIVDNAYFRYRDYILSKYFKEVKNGKFKTVYNSRCARST